MIILRLSGGLGNQMFQYAMGRSLETRGHDVYFDRSQFHLSPGRKYALGCFFNLPIRFKENCGLPVIKEKESFVFDTEIYNLKVGTDAYLIGVWINPKYFSVISEYLSLRFSCLKEPLSKEASFIMDKLIHDRFPPTCMHVRLGDFIKNPSTKAFHGNLSKEYYTEAFEVLQKNLQGFLKDKDKLNIYLFSQDRKLALDFLPDNHSCFFVDHTIKDYERFYLMSRCNHFIIANSTFSWWAAYIAKYGNTPPKKTIIIAPDKIIKPEHHRGIHLQDENYITLKGYV